VAKGAKGAKVFLTCNFAIFTPFLRCCFFENAKGRKGAKGAKLFAVEFCPLNISFAPYLLKV